MMVVAMAICETDHGYRDRSLSPPHSNYSPFYATRLKSKNKIDEEGTGDIGM
jgi:hypothetical protein